MCLDWQEYGFYLILPKLAKVQYLKLLVDIYAGDCQKIQMVKKKNQPDNYCCQ